MPGHAGYAAARRSTQSSNFDAGDPKLADLDFEPPLWRYDYPACTVAERWALLYSAFRAAYAPDVDSPLVDAAGVTPDYHGIATSARAGAVFGDFSATRHRGASVPVPVPRARSLSRTRA